MEQTKKEVLSDIMYELEFRPTLDLEVDEKSYSVIQFVGGYAITGYKTEPIQCKNKTELKKAISKLGKQIILM